MNYRNSLALVLALTVAPLAYAEHDDMGEHCRMHHKMSFEEADSDKDGSLSPDEAKKACKIKFGTMDKDRDGKVTEDELNACGRHKSGKKHKKGSRDFSAADRDHDGTLDRDEAAKLPRVSRHFDEIDVDQDGTVDRDEVHEYMSRHKSH